MMTASLPPVVAAVALAAAATGGAAQPRHEFAELHMGVPVRIVLYADGVTARAAARAAFDRMAALEDVMSDYRPASELRRLEPRAGEWVEVSEPLFDVLARAREIACQTDGAFDPTVAPVIALWRAARRGGRLPDEAARDSARALVDWRNLELDAERRAVRLAQGGMRLDLGGIAKGYILDAAFEALRAHGVRRALLEAGGDVVAGEAPPGRDGWRVEVTGADAAFVARAGSLTRAAIATSGPTRQYVEIEGTRYSHVIDPRTGRALTRDHLTHVIALDAATADALATALGVLGPAGIDRILGRFPGAEANVVAVSHVEPRVATSIQVGQSGLGGGATVCRR